MAVSSACGSCIHKCPVMFIMALALIFTYSGVFFQCGICTFHKVKCLDTSAITGLKSGSCLLIDSLYTSLCIRIRVCLNEWRTLLDHSGG